MGAYLHNHHTHKSSYLNRFSALYPTLHFTKLDVDEVPDVAAELSIRNIPTFIIFKDGERWKEVVSANVRALKEAIEVAVEVEKSENGEKEGKKEEGEGEGGLVLDADF